MAFPTFTADFETGNFTEWSGGQQTVSGSNTVTTEQVYNGIYAHKATVNASGGANYARTLIDSGMSLVEGDTGWWGYAIFLPTGYYAAADQQCRISAFDNFNVDSSGNAARLGMWINSNDRVKVYRHTDDSAQVELIDVGDGPTVLPENAWHYVEMKATLHRTDGAAYTEIWINNVSKGSNATLANVKSTANFPWQRFRGGLADASGMGSAVTAYFDDYYISPTARRGPRSRTRPYADVSIGVA